ncbi:lysine--tRNA ligase [Deinococcus psychrotolerans]|uniref:Lysine--tRNA ligase n=1 Tax=Deinococcus psychrotolerans TaxID=2489213 RepID=A0A3G8YBC0_9DEIO|nr:lysine--tRNA ligase [Deinococcus psychrotolerans]AZI42598.1 lysine--tRNA ligase [Deinococcus psychrotolerans]
MSDDAQPQHSPSQATNTPAPQRQLHEQTIARLNNQAALAEAGFETHPYSYPQTHHAADLLAAHLSGEHGERWDDEVSSLAGRVMLFRHMGGAAFADLQDESGTIQLYFGKKTTEQFAATKKIDLGDIIGVKGVPFVTKTGQLTLEVQHWQPLVKSLHPLPSKVHGLQDEELRARRRYVDLMINPESRAAYRTRSKIVRAIRHYLDDHGFMEVEGPNLQTVPGGTEAKPFKTFHNALSHEFSLRISLELYLKRLLVGGFEKVYEIGRNFRNEGIDRTHNPEFTMLEAYFAYGDYNDMMKLVEEMLHSLVIEIHGQPVIEYQGKTVDFSLPFKRLDFVAALKEAAGLDFDPLDLAQLRAWSDGKHPEFRKVPDYKLLDKLGGEYVEGQLIDPTFLTDMPLVISPLVKAHRSRAGLAERADLYVAGFELAPIYSELNDALDQRARFEAQTARRDAGDDEAHEQDEDFLLALEYGMPPTAGMGMGIDRLTMLLTNKDSIRDVLLFPLLKPEDGTPDAARQTPPDQNMPEAAPS